MEIKSTHYQNHREWEVLLDEKVTNINFENKYYNLPASCIISIYRDQQYDLRATITGIISDPKELDFQGPEIPGHIYQNENIYGLSTDTLYKYKITGIIIAKQTTRAISLDPVTLEFEAELLLDGFEKELNHGSYEQTSIQEWYLGAKSDVSFSYTTARAVSHQFTKARLNIDQEIISGTTSSSSKGDDYLYISTEDFDCLVAKVPEQFGPDWSFNLAIEYRTTLKKIPGAETRKAVSEFVGFVLGTQLLHIGSTAYGKTNNPIWHEYQSPWGDNVVSKCNRSGLSPTKISSFRKNQAQQIINDLLPIYLKERDTLNLVGILWKYWIARQSAVGVNLPIFSSALESLADSILKQHPTFKTYYIEYKEFEKLIEEELIVIENKLNSNLHKEKILNKIRSASQRGSNEKLDMMFEIIKLKIGSQEKKAIKARNKMAHSSSTTVSNSEAAELIKITRTYETLFHRTFLKLLGYTGAYIDYFSDGHPQRNIDTFIP